MRARGDSLAREKTGENTQKYGVGVKDNDSWYLYFYDAVEDRDNAVASFVAAGYAVRLNSCGRF